MLSIIGAVLILALVLLVPSKNIQIGSSDKIVVGLMFIACCMIGITLAVKPNWIRNTAADKFGDLSYQKQSGKKIGRKGHHPDCLRFGDHTVFWKEKALCAGCLGLALGSVIAIIITIIYIEVPIIFSRPTLYIMIFTGLFLIALNYLESIMIQRMVVIHVMFNMILPLSFLLIIIGVFELTGEMIFGLIVILITILWLDTRIQLSDLVHKKICFNCNKKCAES
jgi:hypothetical protein